MIEFTARGTTFCGSAVSPAATPTSSRAAYAKTTPCITRTTAMVPLGIQPPLSVIMCRPGVWPSTGCCVATRKMPTNRNATRVATLTIENQNSISPKYFTETRFTESTTASAISASTHCGMLVKALQYCVYSATAVMSAMPVIDQFRKYIQPAT